MQEWIRQQNIINFRRLLTMAIDENQRLVVLRLLAEEKAKAPTLVAPKDDGAVP